MEEISFDRERLDRIIENHRSLRWALIPLLQKVQEEFGFIPPESIEPIAAAMKVFPSQVQGVVGFYSGFSLKPKGRYVLRACRGTACHVKGSRSLLRFMERELGLREGETSPDHRFTLETVACLGTCFLAPVMMVNQTYFGKLSPAKVSTVLAQYRNGKKDGQGP